jgi:peptide/nickel transport system permease protein
MWRYIATRLAWTLVVLWTILTVTFLATFLSPIDPARSYAGLRASDREIAQVRQEFGLDRPVWIRYERYLGRVAHGDLGTSYSTNQRVLASILDRFPTTLLLALAAGVVQTTLGIIFGMTAAFRRGRFLDRALLGFSLLGVVTPSFVLGFLLLYFLAFKLKLFPLGGNESFSALVLPALTLGIPGAAWYARMLRSSVLNILEEDYVRMAYAKGLPTRVIVIRHVLRNAIGPLIAMIGADIGVFLGGVLVIERVFDWPGIGLQAWRAITFNDVPLVMGTVLFGAFVVTLFNLAADLTNAIIDPRIRYT